MKKLNIKKLAAVGAGLALMSTALAPAFAAPLTKSDVIGSDGSILVDIVVGDNAGWQDFYVAGKLGAKFASMAYTKESKSVSVATPTCAVTGLGDLEAEGGVCSGAAAEVTGKQVSLSWEKKETSSTKMVGHTFDSFNLDSNNTAPKEFFNQKITGYDWPYKTLANNAYTGLYSASRDGDIEADYILTSGKEDDFELSGLAENLYLTADAEFLSSKTKGNRVGLELSAAGFKYELDLGTGIPAGSGADGLDNFVDDTDATRILNIPFLGKLYEVTDISTTAITLQDKRTKTRLNETSFNGSTDNSVPVTGTDGDTYTLTFIGSTPGAVGTRQASFIATNQRTNKKITIDGITAGKEIRGDVKFVEKPRVNTIVPLETESQQQYGAHYVTIYKGGELQLQNGRYYYFDEASNKLVEDSSLGKWQVITTNVVGTAGAGTSTISLDSTDDSFDNALTKIILQNKDGFTGSNALGAGDSFMDLPFKFAKVRFDGFVDQTVRPFEIDGSMVRWIDNANIEHETLIFKEAEGSTSYSFQVDGKDYFANFNGTTFDIHNGSDATAPTVAGATGLPVDAPTAIVLPGAPTGSSWHYTVSFETLTEATDYRFKIGIGDVNSTNAFADQVGGNVNTGFTFLGIDSTLDGTVNDLWYDGGELDADTAQYTEVAIWEFTDVGTGDVKGAVKVYVDPYDHTLIKTDETAYVAAGPLYADQVRYSHPTNPSNDWTLDDQGSNDIQYGVTDYGMEVFTASHNSIWGGSQTPPSGGVLMVVPKDPAELLVIVGQEESITSGADSSSINKLKGETLVLGDYTITIADILGSASITSQGSVGGAGDVDATGVSCAVEGFSQPSPVESMAPRDVDVDSLIVMAKNASAGQKHVVVGGNLVNTLAVAQVSADSPMFYGMVEDDNNYYIQGLTGADTIAAYEEAVKGL